MRISEHVEGDSGDPVIQGDGAPGRSASESSAIFDVLARIIDSPSPRSGGPGLAQDGSGRSSHRARIGVDALLPIAHD